MWTCCVRLVALRSSPAAATLPESIFCSFAIFPTFGLWKSGDLLEHFGSAVMILQLFWKLRIATGRLWRRQASAISVDLRKQLSIRPSTPSLTICVQQGSRIAAALIWIWICRFLLQLRCGPPRRWRHCRSRGSAFMEDTAPRAKSGIKPNGFEDGRLKISFN